MAKSKSAEEAKVVAVDDVETLNNPAMTPGVYAPITSAVLPNTTRDAEHMARQARADRSDQEEEFKPRSVRVTDGHGPRNAEDLAALLRAYPYMVNRLDRLDEEERAVGVEKPDPWESNPVDMLEAAKRFNIRFVDASGNLV